MTADRALEEAREAGREAGRQAGPVTDVVVLDRVAVILRAADDQAGST